MTFSEDKKKKLSVRQIQKRKEKKSVEMVGKLYRKVRTQKASQENI